MSADPAHVTMLLQQASDRPEAARELLPLVYEQLRAAAQVHMNAERPGHTLQATALVHEAFAKMVDSEGELPWENRRHFFAAAGDAMRRILIDHARGKNRVKRGGGRARSDLANIEDFLEADSSEILRFDEVFRRLEDESPEYAAVVRLRFYAGLTVEQAASALGVSTSTVDRRWSLARAWMFRELGQLDVR